jgi:hypothetical protein
MDHFDRPIPRYPQDEYRWEDGEMPGQGRWVAGPELPAKETLPKAKKPKWLTAIVLFFVSMFVASVVVWNLGEGRESQARPATPSASTVGPSPSPSREQAVTELIARTMATMPPEQGSKRFNTIAEGCELLSESQAGVIATGRHAAQAAANPPPGYTGAYARITWGEHRGAFLIVYLSLECAS